MSVGWSRLVLLAAEVTFAVLFLRALLGHLRRRDPLRRDVTLVFAPFALVFCIDIARLAQGTLPRWLSAIAAAAVLAQPYRHTPVLGLSATALAPGDTAPLIATALAGGAVAEALAGSEFLPPRLSLRPAVLPGPHPAARRGTTRVPEIAVTLRSAVPPIDARRSEP